jgi:hypothetical protein
MKRLPLPHATLTSLFAALGLAASPAAHADTRAGFGGFGHWSQGFMLGDFGGLEPALGAKGALGEADSAPGYANTFGGGGRMLMLGGLVLGGRGYGLETEESHTTAGSAKLSGGGGGVDIGWAFLNDGKYIAYPYVGAQGLGFGLDLDNNTDDAMAFGTSHSIESTHSAVFASGTWALDFGMGMHQFLFEPEKGGGGGFVLGGEMGVLVGLSGGEWTDSEDVVVKGVDPFALTTLYMRLNVGGGGYMTKK